MKFSIRSYSLTDGMIAEYVPPSNVDRIKDLHLNETSSGPVVFFSERNQNYFADHFFSDVLEILNPDTLETQVRIKLDESLGTQFSISPDGKKAAIWLLCRWYKADLICKVPNEIFVDEEPDNAPLMNTRLASLWFISDDIEVECRFIMNIRLEICSRVTVMILTLSYSSSSPSET